MEYLLVLRWLVALAVFTALGAPIAAALCPTLPRRGAAFALPAALVPFALGAFWLGQATYGLHALIVALVAVAALSVLSYRAGPGPDWRSVGVAFLVFAVGFTVLVVVRGYTYGLTPAGGEKFLHYGLVKSITRAPALPPPDVWFAGETVQYYYGGHLQIGGLSTLTGTEVRYGFALGNAVFYGILFVAAYGLAGAIAADRGRSYHGSGALGAFFVAVGGSTTTAVRFAHGLLPEDVALRYGEAAFGAVRHMEYPEAVRRLTTPDGWGWFYTRYVVPDTLQEFPAYSFVKGDLHGHALTTGLIVVAAALAYSYYRLPAERRGRRLAVVLAGMGAIAGLFGFMNTWSLPTVVGLAWLAVAACPAHPATLLPDRTADLLQPAGTARGGAVPPWLGRLGAECWRALLAVPVALAVGLVGVAVASPFLIFGEIPSNEGAGLFPPRSPLSSFLVIYGGLFALFLTFVALRSRRPLQEDSRLRTAVVGIGAFLAVAALVALDAAVVALCGLIVAAAWWLVRTDRVGYEGLLIVAGVGLLLSMEVIHARVPPFDEIRWNTTLKVAVQGWTLAATGAAVVAAELLAGARERLATGFGSPGRSDGAPGRPGGRLRTWRPRLSGLAVGALVVAVVLASAAFPVMVFATEIADEESPTVDALADQERWLPDQFAGIYWLDDRPTGTTIVEAPGRAPYTWVNPVSTITGHPTVVGWTHQEQYRSPERFEKRATDVDEIYTGDWERAAAHLREYDVDYVVVSEPEVEAYGDRIRDFAPREGIEVAFENEAITIYEVETAALP